jgi:hypothetical protein
MCRWHRQLIAYTFVRAKRSYQLEIIKHYSSCVLRNTCATLPENYDEF